ncbi:OLC1v1014194C2 [Oldenlandia corymbosa var. corymbosa]|uniref:OLC1v1014194C2 n=1 Tax=Oldenlandia corymbosa var. corymbosa TaxID=529605 RepID=A0AAV1E0Z3_OLDCO|nr:OLC1v1014194C2 [Oldenlandia corymbosa var. corymbosa]
MAGKQIHGDDMSSEAVAGMSKTQLYDIMCQVKQLIGQNQQQARQILIHNPALTKGLFQAQIMLGMVRPQTAPNVQPVPLQNLQQSASSKLPSNIQAASPLPGQISVPEQTRKQLQNQAGSGVSSTSGLPSHIQSPSYPSHLQSKGHIANQQSMPLPQVAQLPNVPPLSHHATSQPPSILQTPMPTASNPLQSSHMPLQPPPPSHLRPPMSGFSHQVPNQIGVTAGFQHSGAPPLHHSQPIYHSGAKPSPGPGPSFQNQHPHSMQPPLQPPYQVGGPRLGPEYNQPDRGSPWLPGLQETGGGGLLPGPPQFTGQMAPGSQSARPPVVHLSASS